MIDPKILTLIKCPIDGQALELAADDIISRINDEISEGRLRDRIDQLVDEPLDQGLITRDGARLYPVRGGIPTLIADAAIAL